MKIFDVDVSVKYISFKLNGEEYLVQFRDNLRKGVHDISILDSHGETNAEITRTYPPLKKWFPEVWQVWIHVWWKGLFRKFRRLHNQ